MVGFLKKFERVVIYTLIVIMMLIVTLATIDLAWIIIKDLLTPPIILLRIEEFLEIFGFILLVLIGIELLETIKAYLIEKIVHMEVVIEVALIAIARKVIILDLEKYSPYTLLGMAGLILSIAAAIFAIRHIIKPEQSAEAP
jgi:uncharacterized membrane protein (DUF373 family)